MKVLVTGGAGYIGSHAVRELLDSGHKVVVLDNLSKGHEEAIDKRAVFIRGSTQDIDFVVGKLNLHGIDAVMHFAADIEVGESVTDPYKYYQNNFANSLLLLEALNICGIKKFVFSSTAAVYGNPERTPIVESDLRNPINPYGRSKMMMEMAIEDGCKAYGIGYTILRYFNVAGASPDAKIGEDHKPESHLIPRILTAAREGTAVKIFGTDYETPDGTCIRDYVHVVDLARAHVMAMTKITEGKGNTYNLGSENGFSVREVISACERVTGRKIIVEETSRRAGDPAVLVASSRKIKEELGWERKYPDMDTIVAHAWNWHTSHPEGYVHEMEKSHFLQMEIASEEYRMAETYRYLGE
jgi:UDP-glucose 4-epimerase